MIFFFFLNTDKFRNTEKDLIIVKTFRVNKYTNYKRHKYPNYKTHKGFFELM